MKSVIHKNAISYITTTYPPTLLIPPFLIQPVPLCLHNKREEDSQEEEEDPIRASQANEEAHQGAEVVVEALPTESTDQLLNERMTVLLQLKSLRR